MQFPSKRGTDPSLTLGLRLGGQFPIAPPVMIPLARLCAAQVSIGCEFIGYTDGANTIQEVGNMQVRCQCGVEYRLETAMAGKPVKCPKCEFVFTAPALPGNGPGQTARPPAANPAPYKTPAQLKQEREDRLLGEFTSQPKPQNLEERIAERHQQSIELNRVPAAVKRFIIGFVCFAFAVGAFILLQFLEQGGVAPIVVWVIVWSGGKWWFPGQLIIIGTWQTVIGILALVRVVDIDEEPQIPTKF